MYGQSKIFEFTKEERAILEVEQELEDAMLNYGPQASYHEGYAIILEELDELWEEIRKRPAHRSKDLMRSEAKQVAAMAIRFMVDLA